MSEGMRRRTRAVSGWVNFPVESDSTGEGGMFVKLVVIDHGEFAECCGASVSDVLSEVLVGDDQRPTPEFDFASEDREDRYTQWIEDRRQWLYYHYPHVDKNTSDSSDYQSRPYLASVVLGTTGWSGWSEKGGGYWRCTYDDLTVKGKALYRQFSDLYKDGRVHLLTFLDT